MNVAAPWNLISADIAAARAFFRKALKRHGQPRTITLDGFEPSHAALRRMGMRNEFNYRWENPVKIRCCPYLNNIVEQDHRRVKSRIQPMLGFKKFSNARFAGCVGLAAVTIFITWLMTRQPPLRSELQERRLTANTEGNPVTGAEMGRV